MISNQVYPWPLHIDAIELYRVTNFNCNFLVIYLFKTNRLLTKEESNRNYIVFRQKKYLKLTILY